MRGLNLGADDYLVEALRDRGVPGAGERDPPARSAAAEDLRLGTVRVDFRSHTAYRGDQELHLTHREFDLLKYLSERPGQVVSRDELLRDLWEYPDPGLTRSVDHAIGRLRRKIEADPQQPRYIHTSVGHGYVLTPRRRPASGLARPRPCRSLDGFGE